MTQPPPPPPAAEQPGVISLTLQGSEMTTSMISPKITVNGYPVPSKYGINTIPMPPGRHVVKVTMQWMRQFGQAETEVDVASGQTAQLFYAAPWHQFTHGSIGFEKQKRRGLGAMIGIIAGILALIAVLVIVVQFL